MIWMCQRGLSSDFLYFLFFFLVVGIIFNNLEIFGPISFLNTEYTHNIISFNKITKIIFWFFKISICLLKLLQIIFNSFRFLYYSQIWNFILLCCICDNIVLCFCTNLFKVKNLVSIHLIYIIFYWKCLLVWRISVVTPFFKTYII